MNLLFGILFFNNLKSNINFDVWISTKDDYEQCQL